jgi:hypothetical protein
MSRIIDKDHHATKGLHHLLRHHLGGLIMFVAMVIALVLFSIVNDNLGLNERPVALGATFSNKYAEQLGVPWREAYLAVLDDLGVRRLRIPVYWDEIEPEQGEFDFSGVDWMIQQASDRNATVILAVGNKTPRWPECHTPEWAKSLEGEEFHDRVLTMVETTVRHFVPEPAIVAWQVENEPLFDFGDCPPPDVAFLKREVAAVRTIDPRPVMITDSGELGTWIRTAAIADTLGISTYRSVWNSYVGYFFWPVTPAYYAKRAQAISRIVDHLIISELQAEPWGPGPTQELTLEEQFRSMNPEHLRENLAFVQRTGFDEAYLWGVEWWYWLKETQGESSMWEEGKKAFSAENNAPAVPEPEAPSSLLLDGTSA